MINEVDLVFVIDTTGSMGSLISSAQRRMIQMIQQVQAAASIDLKVGLVEYRDHPPQDHSFVARPYAFTGDLQVVQQNINRLKADGGGDGPEAVYDGVVTATRQVIWRDHARRLIVLIGDAPPHGHASARMHGDGFPAGCPCGETLESVGALCEGSGITLYGLAVGVAAAAAFGELASTTGGELLETVRGGDAIGAISALLQREFGDLATDTQVYQTLQAQPDLLIDDVAAAVGMARGAVARAMGRLGSRRLLPSAVPIQVV